MAWADQHGLATRLSDLPLILCGPILRRTEPDSVTVWVALKAPRTVTLRVYSRAPLTAPESLTEELQGTRRTVRLGEHLHVAAITARPVEADRTLAPGTVYFYNLFFSDAPVAVVPESADQLKTAGVFDPPAGPSLEGLQPSNLSYVFEHRLPSFALPPEDLNKLRIIHGSCRKPNGVGMDALPALDKMIDDEWHAPDDRPHLLLLTGDQIYADDVAHTLLFLLMDAERALLGWSESLPEVTADLAPRLQPGQRKPIVLGTAWFTTEDPQSHVLSLGEYAAMYLFAWSDALWPVQFPQFDDVKNDAIKRSVYDRERASLLEFQKTLRHARRALANVPSYMIFDDHDVTDDWNMVRFWCENVYRRLLGRRVVQNALLTYAVFQHWGNSPEQFDAGAPGEALLTAAEVWCQSGGTDGQKEQEIATVVGIPGTAPADFQVTGLFASEGGFEQLSRAADALRWHYSVKGPNFDILVLDSRTRRAFSSDKQAPPAHLGPAALDEQLPLDDLDAEKLFLVVSTTNVFTVPLFHGRKVFGDRFIFAWWYIAFFLNRHIFLPFLQLIGAAPKFTLYNPDLKDSWEPQSRAFEAILSRLARRPAADGGRRASRVLVLSGDVHFSWAARTQYWADRPFEADPSAAEPVDAVFAHLTSSALKKEETMGDAFHKWGYIPMTDSLPGAIRWFGWKEPVALGVSPHDVGRVADWVHYEPWMLRRSPPMLAAKEAEEPNVFIPKPDWRYRLDFLLGQKSNPNFGLAMLTKPNPNDHDDWLKVVAEAHSRHRNYAQKWGDGLEIVGKNTIAELRFHWQGKAALLSGIGATDDSFKVADTDVFPAPPFLVTIGAEIVEVGALDRGTGTCSRLARGQNGTSASAHGADAEVEVIRAAVQTNWWRLTDETRLTPLTRYAVSLSYLDPRYPKPRVPGTAGP